MKQKKLFKNFLGISLMMSLILSSNASVSAADVTKNGFTYDTSKYNVSWGKKDSIRVYTEENGVLGTMSYVVGIGRRKKSNDYIIMTKEIMTPNTAKVLMNKSKQYGYGLSEYVSIKSKLPGSLEHYQPVNDPKSDSFEISIGASKDGANVSASYSIVHNDLDITAKCDSSQSLFYIVYDYKPSLVNGMASNKYAANESSQYGIAQIETKASTVKFTTTYDARFGASTNAKRSPWAIYMNYVKKSTGSKNYSFTLSNK